MVKERGAQNPTQLQPEEAGIRGPSDRSQSTYGIPSAVSLGTLQPPVSLKSFICFIVMCLFPQTILFPIHQMSLLGYLYLWFL